MASIENLGYTRNPIRKVEIYETGGYDYGETPILAYDAWSGAEYESDRRELKYRDAQGAEKTYAIVKRVTFNAQQMSPSKDFQITEKLADFDSLNGYYDIVVFYGGGDGESFEESDILRSCGIIRGFNANKDRQIGSYEFVQVYDIEGNKQADAGEIELQYKDETGQIVYFVSPVTEFKRSLKRFVITSQTPQLSENSRSRGNKLKCSFRIPPPSDSLGNGTKIRAFLDSDYKAARHLFFYGGNKLAKEFLEVHCPQTDIEGEPIGDGVYSESPRIELESIELLPRNLTADEIMFGASIKNLSGTLTPTGELSIGIGTSGSFDFEVTGLALLSKDTVISVRVKNIDILSESRLYITPRTFYFAGTDGGSDAQTQRVDLSLLAGAANSGFFNLIMEARAGLGEGFPVVNALSLNVFIVADFTLDDLPRFLLPPKNDYYQNESVPIEMQAFSDADAYDFKVTDNSNPDATGVTTYYSDLDSSSNSNSGFSTTGIAIGTTLYIHARGKKTGQLGAWGLKIINVIDYVPILMKKKPSDGTYESIMAGTTPEGEVFEHNAETALDLRLDGVPPTIQYTVTIEDPPNTKITELLNESPAVNGGNTVTPSVEFSISSVYESSYLPITVERTGGGVPYDANFSIGVTRQTVSGLLGAALVAHYKAINYVAGTDYEAAVDTQETFWGETHDLHRVYDSVGMKDISGNNRDLRSYSATASENPHIVEINGKKSFFIGGTVDVRLSKGPGASIPAHGIAIFVVGRWLAHPTYEGDNTGRLYQGVSTKLGSPALDGLQIGHFYKVTGASAMNFLSFDGYIYQIPDWGTNVWGYLTGYETTDYLTGQKRILCSKAITSSAVSHRSGVWASGLANPLTDKIFDEDEPTPITTTHDDIVVKNIVGANSYGFVIDEMIVANIELLSTDDSQIKQVLELLSTEHLS